MTPAAREPLLEGRGHRDAVEDRIHRDAGQSRPLVQWHAEFGVGLQQLRIHFLQALRAVLLGLRRGVVRDRLVVDRRVAGVRPVRLRQGEPVAQGLQAPLQQEVRLTLLARNQPHDVLVQARGDGLGLDVRDKAVLVLAADQLFEIGMVSVMAGRES